MLAVSGEPSVCVCRYSNNTHTHGARVALLLFYCPTHFSAPLTKKIMLTLRLQAVSLLRLV